jgi:hypothetical protein
MDFGKFISTGHNMPVLNTATPYLGNGGTT